MNAGTLFVKPKKSDICPLTHQYSLGIEQWKVLASPFSRWENWSKTHSQAAAELGLHFKSPDFHFCAGTDIGVGIKKCILKRKVCHYLGQGLLTLALGPSVTLSFGNSGYSSPISMCFQELSLWPIFGLHLQNVNG